MAQYQNLSRHKAQRTFSGLLLHNKPRNNSVASFVHDLPGLPAISSWISARLHLARLCLRADPTISAARRHQCQGCLHGGSGLQRLVPKREQARQRPLLEFLNCIHTSLCTFTESLKKGLQVVNSLSNNALVSPLTVVECHL